MKKIVFIIAVIFAINSIKAQYDTDYGWYVDSSNDTLNHRDYESKYLLPEPFLNNCVSLDVYDHYHTGIRDVYDVNRTINVVNVENKYNFFQPYHSDTIIKIIGISFYGYHGLCTLNNTLCVPDTNVFLEITDTLFEHSYTRNPVILPKYYYDENNNILGEIPHYTEIIFDEPILIQGGFNLVVNTIESIGYRYYLLVYGVKEECPTTQPLPRQKRHNQDSWEEIIYDGWYTNPKKIQALLLFPILGEIEESDTSSSSLNEIYGLNDFVTISPNPTNKQTTIESKYQIKTIEIYNSLGQIVDTKEVNNYSYSMDVSKYNSGHYIIKTTTTNGTVNKKLIVK